MRTEQEMLEEKLGVLRQKQKKISEISDCQKILTEAEEELEWNTREKKQAGQVLAFGKRTVFHTLRVGDEGTETGEVERLLANPYEMLAKVQVAQRPSAVEGVIVDFAHAVDEDYVV